MSISGSSASLPTFTTPKTLPGLALYPKATDLFKPPSNPAFPTNSVVYYIPMLLPTTPTKQATPAAETEDAPITTKESPQKDAIKDTKKLDYIDRTGQVFGDLIVGILREVEERKPEMISAIQANLPLDALDKIGDDPERYLNNLRRKIQKSRVARIVMKRFLPGFKRFLPWDLQRPYQTALDWLQEKPLNRQA